jgi:hypothetical protein
MPVIRRTTSSTVSTASPLGLTDADSELEGLKLADGLELVDGETLVEGDKLADGELDGDKLALSLELGD